MDFHDLFGSPGPSIFQLGATPEPGTVPSWAEIPLDRGTNLPPDEPSSDGIPRLAESLKSSIPRLVDIAIELPTISPKRKLEYAIVEDVCDGYDVDEVSFSLFRHHDFCIVYVQCWEIRSCRAGEGMRMVKDRSGRQGAHSCSGNKP